MSALAQFTDPAQLAENFARLGPGQSLVWALGPSSPGGHGNATRALVERWVAEGRATTAQGRDPREAGRWMFLVYRVEDSEAQGIPGAAARISRHCDPAWEESAEGRIYGLLRRCAAKGLPCPSNGAIAEALGMECAETVRYRFNKLVVAGRVRVIEPARFSARVIEITATGARTAPSDAGRGK